MRKVSQACESIQSIHWCRESEAHILFIVVLLLNLWLTVAPRAHLSAGC